ncbi:MAG: hypothetical protein COZ29_02175, partial [Candidatus Moranbacteria bacterium CG_4_10_14_3_um_filter_45_9]
MTGFDFNTIFVSLIWIFASVSVVSGIYLVVRSFLRFRYQVNQSVNMDLEMIRVTQKDIPEGRQQQSSAEAWKEEILAMEQLLSSLTTLKSKGGFLKSLFFDMPTIVFEIANPSSSEEIFFYLSVPKRFRENAEKQVHSFFPHAVIEKVSDYTIFSPESHTAVSVLELTHGHSLPLRTYRTVDVDPLNEISNALSKLNTIEEGAAIQILLARTNMSWRKDGKKIAQKMQEGKRLKDARSNSIFYETSSTVGREILDILKNPKHRERIKEEKKQVSLTPEEQELVKSIDEKTNKGAFRSNIRLIASGATQERAEEILGHMENAFGQFENPEVNSFRIKKRISEKRSVYDFIFRNFDDETQMILTVEELASIFHFPISTTATPKIKWLKSGTAPPPVNIPQDGLLLGFNDYRGIKTDIRITDNDRRRHMYVIGQTGVGKSVYLQEMAKKD